MMRLQNSNQNPVTYKLFTADLSQVFCGSENYNKIGIQGAISSDSKFELSPVPVAAPRERGCGSSTKHDARTMDKLNDSITEDSTIDNSEQGVDKQILIDTSLADQTRPESVVARLDESNTSSMTEDFPQRSEASSSNINQTDFKNNCGTSDVVSKLGNLDISSTSSLSELSLSKSGRRTRRKSKPLHRCSILNHSLPSIIKPSRFASTSDIAYREQDTSNALSHNASSSRSSSPCGASVSPWTVNGVAFSSSVEVYVFRD